MEKKYFFSNFLTYKFLFFEKKKKRNSCILKVRIMMFSFNGTTLNVPVIEGPLYVLYSKWEKGRR